jgi:hypothetical protein
MGFFIDLFVVMIAIALIVFVVAQVIIPLFSGEPMFSLFRKSAVKAEIVKAEHALETVAEATHLKQVVTELERQTAKLKEPK